MTEPHVIGGLTVGDVYALGGLTVGDVYALGSFVFDEPRALSYLGYITSLGLTAGLQMHLPLSELAGGTAVDTSGAGNDGTYLSAILGQPPLVAGFLYSILGPGYITAPSTVADPAVDSVTIRLDFSFAAPPASNVGLFGRIPAPDRCDLYITPTGKIRFDYFRNSTASLGRVDSLADLCDGLAHSVCVRIDQALQEVEMWVDGVSQGSASIATVTLPSGTLNDWRLNSSYVAGPGVTNYGGPTIWNVALGDADCALMAAGAV